MVATRAFEDLIGYLVNNNPDRLLKYHVPSKTQKRIESLLYKEKNSALTKEEKKELDQYMIVEHIFRMAKARALKSIAE
ncbi:MAG TPA: hypothetical protein ENJ95_24620 [Bacteroidetes bacterium]|nr:hypothetical protein [Bacteroidota bacterium]